MKAQVAYEFLVMLFFLTLAFTVWLVFSANAQSDAQVASDVRQVNDFALQVQDELYAMAELPNGFSRAMSLPATLDGNSYSLTSLCSDDGAGNERLSYVTVQMKSLIVDVQGPPMKCNADCVPTLMHCSPLIAGTNQVRVEDNILYINEVAIP